MSRFHHSLSIQHKSSRKKAPFVGLPQKTKWYSISGGGRLPWSGDQSLRERSGDFHKSTGLQLSRRPTWELLHWVSRRVHWRYHRHVGEYFWNILLLSQRIFLIKPKKTCRWTSISIQTRSARPSLLVLRATYYAFSLTETYIWLQLASYELWQKNWILKVSQLLVNQLLLCKPTPPHDKRAGQLSWAPHTSHTAAH